MRQPIYKKIKKMLHERTMPTQRLPVLRPKTHPFLHLLTAIYHKAKTLSIIIYPRERFTLVYTNFIASAYARNIKPLIEYANENDRLLYQNEDIEKVRQLLTQYGLQLPTPLKLSDSDINISQNDTVVNNNISTGTENNSDLPENVKSIALTIPDKKRHHTTNLTISYNNVALVFVVPTIISAEYPRFSILKSTTPLANSIKLSFR